MTEERREQIRRILEYLDMLEDRVDGFRNYEDECEEREVVNEMLAQ